MIRRTGAGRECSQRKPGSGAADRIVAAAKRCSAAGRIVNIGSVSVRLTKAGMCAYNASKHALTGLTLSLAVELGPDGITANILHPGTMSDRYDSGHPQERGR